MNSTAHFQPATTNRKVVRIEFRNDNNEWIPWCDYIDLDFVNKRIMELRKMMPHDEWRYRTV
jgi:hypothetical protein